VVEAMRLPNIAMSTIKHCRGLIYSSDSPDLVDNTLRLNSFYHKSLFWKKEILHSNEEILQITQSALTNEQFHAKRKLLTGFPEPSSKSEVTLLISLTAREAIEAAPMIKYFLKEILHLPLLELPEFVNNNYVWFGLHYAICNIGIFSTLGKVDLTTSLMLSTNYASKILTYEYLAEQRQEKFQGTLDKSIDNPIKFIDKCGIDILAQAALAVMNNGILTAPAIYELTISATVGGMQCYHLYKQAEKTTKESIAQNIIPYIADVIVGTVSGYALTQINPLDFSTITGKAMVIKHSFVVISFIVITDYMTKALLTTYHDFYPENITNLAGNIYEYFVGESESPEL